MVDRLRGLALGLTLLLASGSPAAAEQRFLTLASTTSTENSGLLGAILPVFEKQSGIEVRVVAVGTGQALRLARNGDADVLLVHDRASEERFVEEGYGVERHDVMYNDFVIVGPRDDPAGVAGTGDAAAALARIAAARAPFVSRADDSGTHKAEQRLWSRAAIDPAPASGTWYRETGSGMGATLNSAAAMGAYTLSDRATWIAFRNRDELAIAVEGDPMLFNPYGLIQVSSTRHPHVKQALAERFIEWMLSPEGQGAIAGYRLRGKALFYPNARGAAQSASGPEAD